MRSFLNRYNEPFSIKINPSKKRMIDVIAQEKGKKRNFFGLISSNLVDFREVTILDENIIIDVKPKILNPFRGAGEIHINLLSGDTNSETTIEGEIIPFDGIYVFTIYMVMGFLALWYALNIAVSSGWNSIIMLAFGWTIFPLVLILIPIWYRSRLREHRDYFLDTLNRNCKQQIIPKHPQQ